MKYEIVSRLLVWALIVSLGPLVAANQSLTTAQFNLVRPTKAVNPSLEPCDCSGEPASAGSRLDNVLTDGGAPPCPTSGCL